MRHARTAAAFCAIALAGCSHEPETYGKLRVAAVYTTPIEEPWNGRVHEALIRGSEELGIDYRWAESVPMPDYERVVREYAGRGCRLILGDAFGSEDGVRRVAKDFPNTAFCFGSGLGPAEPNLSVFDDWIHEPAYLCGLLAGRLTKSNTIGVVGGYPVPEVNRIVNAFIAGAKEANPKAAVKVSFINAWFDPPKAKEAALAQIALGADVLFAERYGVIEAAKDKGVLAFGNLSDQVKLGPDTVVTSPVWDMYPTVEHAVRAVKAGAWKARDYAEWSMMKKGGASLAPFYHFKTRLDPALIELVRKKERDIKRGSFAVAANDAVPVAD